MSYKNFKTLNQSLSRTVENQAGVLFERLLRDARSLVSIPGKLATDWARSYAGVMVLKYDSNGNPTDVTDDVTTNGKDAPNSLIANVQNQWNTAKLSYDSDKQALTSYSWTQRAPINIKATLPNMDVPGQSGVFKTVNWVTISPGGTSRYFAGVWSTSNTYFVGIIPDDPQQFDRAPDGSEMPVAFQGYSDQAASQGFISVIIKHRTAAQPYSEVTHTINFSWQIRWADMSVTFVMNIINGETGLIENSGSYTHTYGTGFTGRMIKSVVDQWDRSSQGGNAFSSRLNAGMTISLGDIAFTDTEAIDDIGNAINDLTLS